MNQVTVKEAQEIFNEMAETFMPEVLDKKEFNKQLVKFISEDFSNKYRYISNTEDYIIKVFVYQVKQGGKAGTILMPDMDGTLKLSGQTSFARRYINLAKIIKVGSSITNPKYQEGDLVVLPVDETTGSSPNPDFVAAMQYANSFGAEKPILPQGLKKELDTIHAKWKPYYFLLPEEYGTPVHLISTFIVSPYKILAKYDLKS